LTHAFGVFDFSALGTGVRIVTSSPTGIDAAREAVERELDAVDRAYSRFRPDSELAAVQRAAGAPVKASALLIDAFTAALWAARETGGAVDPTLGAALRRLGYDRDFALIQDGGALADPAPIAAPDWRLIDVDVQASTVRIPEGIEIDLGATGKALAADRCADAALQATGVGVLVSLGGDIAVAGPSPAEGWPVLVTDDHAASLGDPGQTVVVKSGGLATSSTTVRRWSRAGVEMHHIVDPRTGLPATSCWKTVSVTASSCVVANAYATAAIVWSEDGPERLEKAGMAARLVRPDGSILKVGGWPEGGESPGSPAPTRASELT
jgi:FAD:protein FMN transferase